MDDSAVGKSSVSALQEYCAKKRISCPDYEWVEAENGSYVCQVEILGIMSEGFGRSKRDAKHQAAANAIKKIRLSHPDIDEIPQSITEVSPIDDMIVVLRDYCVQNDHPLPTIEVVQQAGSPDAPEFTALCKIATIKRYGVSENKKDARQKAALEMIRAVIDDKISYNNHQVGTLKARTEYVEEQRYQKFRSYRELTDTKSNVVPGILLCDRHNHFIRYHEHLKIGARNILNTPYESPKAHALEVFEALKLKPRTTELIAQDSLNRIIFIELDCDYDVVFAGLETKVYERVLNYFNDML